MVCEESVLEFFLDGDVLGFFSEQVRRYVPRREFEGLEPPGGMSCHGAWEVLCGMRKVLGIPIRSSLSRPDGRDVWYNVTPAMSSSAARIVELSREPSPLSRSLARRADRGLTLQPVVEELVSVLARCGIGMDPSSCVSLLQGHRPPDDGHDALALNIAEIMRDLPALSSRKLDRSLFEEIFDRMREGAAAHGQAEAAHRVPMPYYRQGATRDEVLDEVERMYAPHRAGSASALIAGISASDAIWQYAPFGLWSGAMELALRAVFFTKIGCPALAYCPFSERNREWETGSLTARLDGYAINETDFESPLGIDATVFYAQKIGILEEGLGRMLEALSVFGKRRDSLGKAVEKDPRLNHRQRAVLMGMIDDPSMRLDAKAHQANHAVALMTARTDLKKLVEYDYLYRSESGGRTIFRACPDIAVKLSRLTETPL